MHYEVVIVGGGHAGAQAAIMLRQLKFAGSIAIIGEEAGLPYERPPLSKDYFSGEKSAERLLIRPAAFWDERAITLLTGHRVDHVDAAAQSVTARDVESGTDLTIGYASLIWAAGGHARAIPVPGAALPGVLAMRTIGDADALRAATATATATQIVIIGGGYIGLESAAVLAKAGKPPILIETENRVLARVAAEPLSRFFEREHRAHGVDIRLNAAVTAIEGEARVEAVRLADGTRIACTTVLVGIGITAAVAPLLAAGAAGAAGGIAVDAHCRTTLPHIHAIGDCAAHANDFAGGAVIRVESVQNANDQATLVAKALCGDAQPYAAVPWFWSNQYDLRLQTVGVSAGYDAAVVRGDPAARSFSVITLKSGRVIALDCVNMVRDYVQGRALVLAGARIAPERLADAGTPLKELLAAA